MTSTSPGYSVSQPAIALPSAPRTRRRVLLFVAATALVGAGALVLAMWLGGNLTQSNILGLAIGGTSSLTGWGLPATKLVMDLSSIGVIGMLLACVLLPGRTTPDGTMRIVRRFLRTAAWLAVVWGVSNGVLLVFSWSDVVAQPVTDLPYSKLFTDTARTFPDAAGFITSTALALVIAVGLWVTETRRGAWILLPVAVYNLIPMALEGHASHGTLLKYSIGVHVVAASLWVGGLAALLMHLRSEPGLLAVTVPRFSAVALACYTAIAASGVIAGWQLLGSVSAIWGSQYGVVLILKAAALVALGVFGWWHRRHTVHRLRADEGGGRARRAFVKLAAAEVAIMVAAVAIAVALSRSASPDSILLHSSRKTSASAAHTQPPVRG